MIEIILIYLIGFLITINSLILLRKYEKLTNIGYSTEDDVIIGFIGLIWFVFVPIVLLLHIVYWIVRFLRKIIE